MLRNFEAISFDLFAWSDAQFRTTFRRVPELLGLSVREMGILNPLIVSETFVSGRFLIVTGWLRFLAARELEESSAPCHVFRGVPPKVMMLCGLLDNLGHRSLNPVEQALALVKLEEFYSREEILKSFGPLLGIGPVPVAGAEQLFADAATLAGLPESLRWVIVDGLLTAEAACILAPFPYGHMTRLLALFGALRMSATSQRELARDFAELWTQQGTTPTEVILDEGWNWVRPEDGDEKEGLLCSWPELEATGSPHPLPMAVDVDPEDVFQCLTRSLPPDDDLLLQGDRVAPGSESSAREALVRRTLNRRLGKRRAMVSDGTGSFPEEVRFVNGRRSGGVPSRRLEVRFENPDQLRSLLHRVLDAQERGALKELLGSSR